MAFVIPVTTLGTGNPIPRMYSSFDLCLAKKTETFRVEYLQVACGSVERTVNNNCSIYWV